MLRFRKPRSKLLERWGIYSLTNQKSQIRCDFEVVKIKGFASIILDPGFWHFPTLYCSLSLVLDGYRSSRHDVCLYTSLRPASQKKKKKKNFRMSFLEANDWEAPNGFALNLNFVTCPFFTNYEWAESTCYVWLLWSDSQISLLVWDEGILLEDRDTQQGLWQVWGKWSQYCKCPVYASLSFGVFLVIFGDNIIV